MRHLACLVVLVAACTGTDAPAPTSLEYDSLALSVGTTVASSSGGGELGALGDVTALAHGAMPAGFVAAGDGTVSGTHAGLAYTYRVTTDGDATIAEVSWRGSLDLPDFGLDFERSGTWTIRGDAATGSAAIAYRSRDASGTYALSDTADYTIGMPASGTMHYGIDVERTTDQQTRAFTVDATLELTGDGKATLDLDGNQQYRVDLATGAVVRA